MRNILTSKVIVITLASCLLLQSPIISVVMSLSSSSSPASTGADRPYDLVIYGATGFTGQLAVAYVHRNYPHLKYALAGRNRAKLEQVRAAICGPDSTVPIIVADAVQQQQVVDVDPASSSSPTSSSPTTPLQQLVAQTKVIANYAGTPFFDKALPVVAACAKYGTCYTDITGEVPFQRASYDRYHQDAEQSGALIIHACGFDSVPSDLGAMLAADAMKETYGCECASIELVTGPGSGAVSGGTIHTALALIFNGGRSRDRMPGLDECRVRGSYSLDPHGGTGGPDTSDSVSFVSYDPVAQSYVIPFVMAGANAPVVRKSNALFNYRYGRTCTYREVQSVAHWSTGLAGLLGFGLFAALLAMPPTRWLLVRYVLPKPGEGPTKQQQDNGHFISYIYAVGADDKKPVIKAFVSSGNAGDPGYKATAQMSIEASLCMALERESCAKGGVLTPATGLGKILVDRLNRSGMKLGVEASSTRSKL